MAATLEDYKNLIESKGWLDIVEVIDDKIQDALDTMSITDDEKEWIKLQGSVAELRGIKLLPELTIEEFLENAEIKKEEKEDD